MLTHIVCWKYKAETTPEMRADQRAKLMALPEIIRNSVSFNVGADILHLERSFDTGLVAVRCGIARGMAVPRAIC